MDGLVRQIEFIVLRVLDGRVIRPAEEINAARERRMRRKRKRRRQSCSLSSSSLEEKEDTTHDDDTVYDDDDNDEEDNDVEADELRMLGLTSVPGLLLYGSPGCGKTTLAREISQLLGSRTPKIVAAPELLDRWVGGSERLVCILFADAEAE